MFLLLKAYIWGFPHTYCFILLSLRFDGVGNAKNLPHLHFALLKMVQTVGKMSHSYSGQNEH